MKYTLELQRIMQEEHCLIALRDNFEDLLAKSVLRIIEKKIEHEDVDAELKSKVFGVVVECVQTICSTDNTSSEKKDAVLLLSRIRDGYKIEVGTPYAEDKVKRFNELFPATLPVLAQANNGTLTSELNQCKTSIRIENLEKEQFVHFKICIFN